MFKVSLAFRYGDIQSNGKKFFFINEEKLSFVSIQEMFSVFRVKLNQYSPSHNLDVYSMIGRSMNLTYGAPTY